jgi:pyridoxamine 5'-phosphate oxidase
MSGPPSAGPLYAGAVTAAESKRLADLREEYTLGGLDRDDLDEDPVVMLERWLADAIHADLRDPTAMVVSTVSATGRPSSRMVLCKGLSEAGLVFYTNYGSQKGEELAGTPACAALFPWHPLQRQVRVEGTVSRIDPAASDAYFATRPRPSQLGAVASPQSRVVPSRAWLDERYAEVEARYAGQEVPRPSYWGGYLVRPERFEFWQGRKGRLHDRFRYEWVPTQQRWQVDRLGP